MHPKCPFPFLSLSGKTAFLPSCWPWERQCPVWSESYVFLTYCRLSKHHLEILPAGSGHAWGIRLSPPAHSVSPAEPPSSSLKEKFVVSKCLQQSCHRYSFLLPPHPTYLGLTPLKGASPLAFRVSTHPCPCLGDD